LLGNLRSVRGLSLSITGVMSNFIFDYGNKNTQFNSIIYGK
jgi:hypothetical protein